jgi:hypothetical protein
VKKKEGDEDKKWSDPFSCLWKVIRLSLGLEGIYANSSAFVMKGTHNYIWDK